MNSPLHPRSRRLLALLLIAAAAIPASAAPKAPGVTNDRPSAGSREAKAPTERQ